MKSYVLAFAICFAVIDLSFALGKEDQEKCLRKNGLNNSTDVELMKAFVRSDGKNEFHLEREFSCVVACVIDERRTEDNVNTSTYQLLTDLISEAHNKIPDEQWRDMKTTLDKCHQQDEGDDCKLLYCVKILRDPFKELIVSFD
uniref:Putative odorant binding protein 32 n=1 Tax=Nasonia vitripennis TaxID=7425 RepID=G8B1N7_NASVI|nr:putative odorant binding protein 32 [Nasonia vitripennis]